MNREAARIDLQKADLRLQNEQKKFNRASEFRKQQTITEAEYDEAVLAVGIAEADHKMAELELERAEATLRAAQATPASVPPAK